MIKAITHTTVYDFHRYLEDAYVIFDEQIIDVGLMKDFIDHDYTIIDGKDHLILPGLICGHTHIYSAFARGLSLPFSPKNFQEILDQLWWKLDGALTLDMVYNSGIVFGLDFLKNGVTTVIDHHASGQDILGTLNALKKSVTKDVGLRGVFAFETSDRFDIDQCIKENVRFAKQNQSDRVRGLFGLHASSSLSEQTLRKISKRRNDIPIHIHVAESHLDEEIAMDKYHMNIISRLEKHHLISPNSIIAHAIHISDQELDQIKMHKGVIAVNFTSNMNNGVGTPNLHRFKERGIPVILGNDGISSAMTTEYLMAYYMMHHMDQSPNPFQLSDLHQMIKDTYQYASNLFETKLGQIEKGYEADLLMLPYVNPTPMNQDNAFGHLFFGTFHAFKPKHVWIKGKHMIKNYQAKPVIERKYKEAIQSSTQLWENLKKEV